MIRLTQLAKSLLLLKPLLKSLLLLTSKMATLGLTQRLRLPGLASQMPGAWGLQPRAGVYRCLDRIVGSDLRPEPTKKLRVVLTCDSIFEHV